MMMMSTRCHCHLYARLYSKVLGVGISSTIPHTCLHTSCHGNSLPPQATLAFMCTLVCFNSYSNFSFWSTCLHNLLTDLPSTGQVPIRASALSVPSVSSAFPLVVAIVGLMMVPALFLRHHKR